MRYLVLILSLEVLLRIGYLFIYPGATPPEIKQSEIVLVGDSVMRGMSLPGALNLEQLSATSEDTLDMVRKAVRFTPKTIIIHCGYNDDRVNSKKGFRRSYLLRLLLKPFPSTPSFMDYQNTTTDIHRECSRNGVEAVFLTISTRSESERIGRMNRWLMSNFKTIEISLKPEHFLNDIHLNDSGYQEMARQVSLRLNGR